MMGRILEIRKVEIVEVRPGEIYRHLNQGGVLDKFPALYPTTPAKLTALYLTLGQEPVEVAVDARQFTQMVSSEIARVIKGEECRQIHFQPANILPESGRTIPGLLLVHLFAHILLFYAVRCREPVEEVGDFPYTEVVFRNQYNLVEFIIVFNFPTRTAHVCFLADVILNYLNRWVKGERTSDFFDQMKEQATQLDSLRLGT